MANGTEFCEWSHASPSSPTPYYSSDGKIKPRKNPKKYRSIEKRRSKPNTQNSLPVEISEASFTRSQETSNIIEEVQEGRENISDDMESDDVRKQPLLPKPSKQQKTQYQSVRDGHDQTIGGETDPLLGPEQRCGRKCLIFIIIIICLTLVILLGCIAEASISRKITTSNVQKSPISLYIAPLSVTEVDLRDYGIDGIKNQGIKITKRISSNPDFRYTGVLEAASQNGDIDCTMRPLKLTNAPFNHGNLLVRYWPRGQVPTGTIECSTNNNHLWIWSGTLRNLTTFNCNSEDLFKQLNFSCSQSPLNVSDVANIVHARAQEDEDLVAMLFCSDSQSNVMVSINIEECLPIPTNHYTTIYVNGYTNPTNNSMTVKFKNMFNLYPKVYIDTEGLKNFQNKYDKIEIQVNGIRNENFWKLGAATSIALFVLLILYICMALYCRKRGKKLYPNCCCF